MSHTPWTKEQSEKWADEGAFLWLFWSALIELVLNVAK